MKNPILTILLLFCVALATAQDIKPAPADKAVVYFVRPSSLGLAINFSYFDSAKLVGKFNGPNYMRYECEPGRHLFWARSENRDFVEAEVEAGKIYFIEAIVQMGAVKAAVNLQPINPNDSKRMKKILALLTRKPGKSFTSEDLEAEGEDMKDVIERGVEKYNSDKQKGKSFALLDKNMYYNQ